MSTCFHCSEKCEQDIRFDEKVFCCTGCKTVYQLLNQNNLGNYYLIEKNPGLKPGSKLNYEALDNQEIVQGLIDFENDNITKCSVFIPNIHCSSCIWLLENLSKVNPIFIESKVHFHKKELTFTIKGSSNQLKEIFYFLSKLGYPPTLENKKGEQKSDNSLTLKLALSGFCFGNIMLLSFPEYLSIDSIFIQEFRSFFSILILILSIPILLYSAIDYLRSAFNSILLKKINIDIPISLGIIVLYGKSIADIINGNGPGYMDSFSGFIFFLLIGKWFQSKTYDALSFERDYKSYFPMAVEKNLENETTSVPIDQIKKGDVIRIKNEEIIPSDGILTSQNCVIDYSFVTGESTHVQLNKNQKIFAGGKIVGNSALIIVSKAVNQSYLTQLWNNTSEHQKSKLNQLVESENLSKYFVLALFLISILAGSYWFFVDTSEIINVITSVLIVACPCALALAIPFTYGNSLRYLGKKGLYLKNTQIVEHFSNITDIVFDKTGTLTKNNTSTTKFEGRNLSQAEINEISSIVFHSSHPLSVNVLNFLSPIKNQNLEADKFKEISGAGISSEIGNHHYLIGSAQFAIGQSIEDTNSNVYVSKNGEMLGKFIFENDYRTGTKFVLKKLGQKYKLHLLTGDNSSELKKLENFFPKQSHLNFRQSPSDKMKYIEGLKKNQRHTLMIGDGLNDAGALQAANIGIVVSEDVFNFSPACDGILDVKELNSLPQIIDFGLKSRKTLRYCYVLSVFYNIIGLSFAVTGHLTPLVAAILMPLSSITIVIYTSLKIRRLHRQLIKT